MYIEDLTELGFNDVTPDDPDFTSIQGQFTCGCSLDQISSDASLCSFYLYEYYCIVCKWWEQKQLFVLFVHMRDHCMPVFSPYTRACLRTWNDVCTGLAEAGLIPSNLSQRDAEFKTGTAHSETVSLFYPDRFFLSSVEQSAIFISCLCGVQFLSFFCTLDRSITMVLTWTYGLFLRVEYVAGISVVCESHVVLALRGLALSLQNRSIVT